MKIVILRGDGNVVLRPEVSSYAEIVDVARWLSSQMPYVVTVEEFDHVSVAFHHGKEVRP